MLTNHCLTRQGYLVLKESLTPQQERQIIKDLTVKPTVLPAYRDFVKPKPYKIYYQSQNAYYLPKYYAIELFGQPKFINIPEGSKITAKCLLNPLSFQQTAAKILDNTFSQAVNPYGAGGVLSLPCGYGKTFLALRAVCKLGYKAIVIVNKEFLMDQWVEAAKKFTTLKVGILQRDRVEVSGNDIVIAMIHSLCLKEYPPELFQDFGLAVYDECHHVSSETFSKSMMKVRPRFTLGLSATPERRDGLSHVFYKFLGPLLHKEKRQGTNQVIVKQINISSTSSHYKVLFMANNTKNTGGMATAISQFPERNRLLLEILQILIKQGRTILLLSSRRDHLHDLNDLITSTKLKKPDGKEASYGFYYGKQGSNKNEHRQMLNTSAKCDIVLGTDAIAKEGLDIPSLNTIVFATPPGVDVEQAVGRILRKYHEDFYPMVVDLVDKTGNFSKHASERNKWYTDENYEIQNLAINLYDEQNLNNFSNDVCSFLNTKKYKSTGRRCRSEPEPDPEPDFNNIMLDPSTVKIKKPLPKKILTVNEAKKRIYGSSDDPFTFNSNCLLTDERALVQPRRRSTNEPQFDSVCMLDDNSFSYTVSAKKPKIKLG